MSASTHGAPLLWRTARLLKKDPKQKNLFPSLLETGDLGKVDSSVAASHLKTTTAS